VIRNIIISSTFHLFIIFIAAMSLPFLSKKPIDLPPIISIELIQITEKTNIPFALIKAYVFAFIVSSISAFQGYYTSGGALEVGKSSTNAVTNSCIAILIADYILAQILL